LLEKSLQCCRIYLEY